MQTVYIIYNCGIAQGIVKDKICVCIKGIRHFSLKVWTFVLGETGGLSLKVWTFVFFMLLAVKKASKSK